MSLIHASEQISAVERQGLIAKYIVPDPHHPGTTHYRLRESAVSVWVLVAYYETVGHDLRRVVSDYDLPEKHVQAALAFYVEYADAVDAYLSARIEKVSDG